MASEAIYALLARIVQGAIMFVVGVLVIRNLSPDEQGYFFTFMSLGALLQMGDFGLSYAVLHNANHLSSVGQTARLPGLLSRALWLNCLTSSCLAIVVGVGGIRMFGASQHISDPGGFLWYYPWIFFVCAVFLTQLMVPGIAFFEGGISAVAAWRFRFFQEALSGPVFIGFLLYGCGLWSLAAFWSIRFAMSGIWLWVKKPQCSEAVSFTNQEWHKEVWPFQWKMGLSALSGFLIFQAVNPIVLAEQGPKVAGQFGFSLAIMNMVLMVTTVWPLSKAAQYGYLISTTQFKELRRSFWQVTIRSSLFAGCSAVGVSLGLWWLIYMGISFADRLADLFTTSALMAAAVAHHVVYCFAVLLRAERREPLLWVSVIGGLVSVLAIWMTAHFGGSHDIAVTNLIFAGIGIPLVYIIFRRRVAFWKVAHQLPIESLP